MVQMTPVAVTKVKEILSQQTPQPEGLRVAVVGGGCSGFSYHMAFENQINENSDNVYEFEGLKVLVDQMSEMYLDGISIDYIETIEGSGFKFNNPNAKSTCGCGISVSFHADTRRACPDWLVATSFRLPGTYSPGVFVFRSTAVRKSNNLVPR